MDTLYAFINDMLKSVPADVGSDVNERVVLPDNLPSPKRVKLCYQLLAKSALSAGELLIKMMYDRDDVACMRDVEEYPFASLPSPPPYIS